MDETVKEITGHYLNVNHIKTYYEMIGGGKALLCLHTAGRDCRQWHFLMEYFSKDYKVIAIDMPGHGKSWPLKGCRAIEDSDQYADFIYQFLTTLAINEIVIIGCSLGGNISLMLAQRFPSLVKAIIPMEGADYTPTISSGSLKLMMSPLVNLHSYNMDFTLSLIGKKAPPEVKEFLEWSVWQLTPQAQYGDLKAYSQLDVRDKMGDISCPVLLIRGTDDWIVDQRMVEATKTRLTKSVSVEFEVLKDVGHFPHVEQPQWVCQLIEKFLNKHTKLIWSK